MIRSNKILPVVLATALGAVSAPAAFSQSADTSAGSTASAQASHSAELKVVQAHGLTSVEQELRSRGYKIIKEGRTLLGRYYVRAENEAHVREVVVHQKTGEVLSDVVVNIKAGSDAATNTAARANSAEQSSDRSNGSGAMGIAGGGSVGVNVGGSVGVSLGGSSGGSVDVSIGGSADASSESSMGGGLGLGN